MRLMAAFALLFVTAVAFAQTPAGLVETWQFVTRVDHDADGKTAPEPSLGADPVGYLIYDNSEHVAVQMTARTRGSDPCQVTAPASANNLATVGGYDAYFGRYEVDSAAGTVTHIL